MSILPLQTAPGCFTRNSYLLQEITSFQCRRLECIQALVKVLCASKVIICSKRDRPAVDPVSVWWHYVTVGYSAVPDFKMKTNVARFIETSVIWSSFERFYRTKKVKYR